MAIDPWIQLNNTLNQTLDSLPKEQQKIDINVLKNSLLHCDEAVSKALQGKVFSSRERVREVFDKLKKIEDMAAKIFPEKKDYERVLQNIQNVLNEPYTKDGATLLHDAVKKGDIKEIERLIAMGASINKQDNEGNSVLHIACKSGQMDVVKLLLTCGATITLQNKDGKTARQLAAENGNAALVKLLEAKANINVQDADGQTPLHRASFDGKNDLVKFLLSQQEVQVNIADPDGITPLHWAASFGNKEIVELLINKGANVNAQAAHKSTPLHFAVADGNKEAMELLISKGANVNAQDEDQETPLHVVCRRFGDLEGTEEAVKSLLTCGATITLQNKDGKTARQVAAGTGKAAIVELLEAKANINVQDADGKTPLHRAIFDRKNDLVKFLLSQQEVQVNIADSDGKTPLHWAAAFGNKEIVELLISKGANVNAQTANKTTPLHMAAFHGDKEIVELLLSKGANIDALDAKMETPLHKAAFDGNKATVEFLISKGANIDAKDAEMETPLHKAAFGGNKATVEFLISKGAKVDALDAKKRTPFYFAAAAASKEVMELLISKGANANAQDESQNTPLHVVCRGLGYLEGTKEAVKFLVTCGATITLQNKDGKTARQLAAESGKAALVELFEAKENINVRDADGKTPLHRAILAEDNDLIKFLLSQPEVQMNIADSDGCTPLLRACKEGRQEIFALLVGNSDVNAKDKEGRTALHYACERGDVETIALLLSKNANSNVQDSKGRTPYFNLYKRYIEQNREAERALRRAAAIEDQYVDLSSVEKKDTFANFLKRFHEGGVDPFLMTQEQESVLHLACAAPINPKFLEEVLVRATPAQLRVPDKNGNTPLHILSHMKNYDAVKFLIVHHKVNAQDLNIKNRAGFTPLSFAIDNDDQKIQNYLLQHGAKLPVRITDGSTFHRDLKAGKVDDVLKCLQKGKEEIEPFFSLKDTGGNTLFHLACKSGNQDIIEKIFGCGAWTSLISSRNADQKTALQLLLQSKLPKKKECLLSIFTIMGVEDPAALIPEDPKALIDHLSLHPELLIQNVENPIEFCYFLGNVEGGALSRKVATKLEGGDFTKKVQEVVKKYPGLQTESFIDHLFYDVDLTPPTPGEKEKILKVTGLPKDEDVPPEVSAISINELDTLFDKLEFLNPEKDGLVVVCSNLLELLGLALSNCLEAC